VRGWISQPMQPHRTEASLWVCAQSLRLYSQTRPKLAIRELPRPARCDQRRPTTWNALAYLVVTWRACRGVAKAIHTRNNRGIPPCVKSPEDKRSGRILECRCLLGSKRLAVTVAQSCTTRTRRDTCERYCSSHQWPAHPRVARVPEYIVQKTTAARLRSKAAKGTAAGNKS